MHKRGRKQRLHLLSPYFALHLFIHRRICHRMKVPSTSTVTEDVAEVVVYQAITRVWNPPRQEKIEKKGPPVHSTPTVSTGDSAQRKGTHNSLRKWAPARAPLCCRAATLITDAWPHYRLGLGMPPSFNSCVSCSLPQSEYGVPPVE